MRCASQTPYAPHNNRKTTRSISKQTQPQKSSSGSSTVYKFSVILVKCMALVARSHRFPKWLSLTSCNAVPLHQKKEQRQSVAAAECTLHSFSTGAHIARGMRNLPWREWGHRMMDFPSAVGRWRKRSVSHPTEFRRYMYKICKYWAGKNRTRDGIYLFFQPFQHGALCCYPQHHVFVGTMVPWVQEQAAQRTAMMHLPSFSSGCSCVSIGTALGTGTPPCF